MKPSKATLTLCYTCPNCGSEWWYGFDELKFTTGIQCGCGQVLKFDPISTVRISPIYGKSEPFLVQKVKDNPVDRSLNDDVVKVLRDMGFKKQEAEAKVRGVLANHNPKDEAEFLSLCFKKGI